MRKFWNKIGLFKKCASIYVVFITVPTLFFAFFCTIRSQNSSMIKQFMTERQLCHKLQIMWIQASWL